MVDVVVTLEGANEPLASTVVDTFARNLSRKGRLVGVESAVVREELGGGPVKFVRFRWSGPFITVDEAVEVAEMVAAAIASESQARVITTIEESR